MSFRESINRVKRAERALIVNERAVGHQWQRLHCTWRDAWTPGRIVIAGLASGFIIGRAELPKVTGSGVVELVTALGSLFAVEQADSQR